MIKKNSIIQVVFFANTLFFGATFQSSGAVSGSRNVPGSRYSVEYIRLSLMKIFNTKLKLKNSIGIRLLRFVFGSYLLVTIIMTSSQLYSEYLNAKSGVLTQLTNVAQSFSTGIGKALWNLDYASVDSILRGVEEIHLIDGAKVNGLSGDLFSSIGYIVEDLGDLSGFENGAVDIDIVNLKSSNFLENFYQLRYSIAFVGHEYADPEPMGYVYLYVNQNKVVETFKNSFFVIILTAVLKTVFLWAIFLYFSNRLLAKPLNNLTLAAKKLKVNSNEKNKISSTLQGMANVVNKSELDLLAENFIDMQQSIVARIDNLNNLNDLSVQLTEASAEEEIFSRTFSLIQKLLGSYGAVVINSEKNIIWSNLSSDKHKELIGNDIFSALLSQNCISYQCSDQTEEGSENTIISNILYLPIYVDKDNSIAMFLFGEIKSDRLNKGQYLNQETLSMLQVVANISSATLTNIEQKNTIKKQNNSLEKRVQERTEDLAKVNEELKYLSLHDPLTELPNRVLFNDRLQHTIYTCTRENTHFAVASIDLTKFKMINDTYGHEAGDIVLIEAGKRLSRSLRDSDTLARMGGDEFAAILIGGNINNSIEQVVRRLTESLQDPIYLEDNASVLVNANIGVALFPDHATDSKLLFKFADIAMYQAKNCGHAYDLFDKSKNKKEMDHLQFMQELEYAIDNGQMRLFYQPIVDIHTLEPIAMESLIRWQHPERGLVPPDSFIPYAERTSLIRPMTEWVLKTAIKQCAEWHEQGLKLRVSVNLSARIFSATELSEQLNAILQQYGLEPQWLKLEITETAAMTNPEHAMKIIKLLSDKGFVISIDDFGTGHSSLSYLTQLPVNELKIDKSFVMDTSDSSGMIIQTIIDLAHSLNFSVVAEGIEDKETLQKLIDNGCDAAQGYYVCKPANAETIDEWLQQFSTNMLHNNIDYNLQPKNISNRSH